LEKPIVNEREHAMGFCISTIVVQNIFKKTHRRILGQVMDLNGLTWIFQFGHNITKTFYPFTPTHCTPSFTCCSSCWVSYVSTWGERVMLQQNKHIFGNCGITDTKENLWVRNRNW
jgi:hypothetical protein